MRGTATRIPAFVAALLLLATAACSGGGTVFTTPGADSAGITGRVTADGAGFGGVTVLLGANDSTVTDATGTFLFSNLAAGSYTVGVRVPLGYTLAPGQQGTQTATVTSNGLLSLTFALNRTTTGTP